MKFDSKAFLSAFEPQFPKLNKSAKQGLSFLIEQINADTYDMLEHVAYVLATAYWESDRTFQPVREKRASKRRQPNLYRLQNRYWDTGAYGRGFVQTTWPENYCKFGLCKREDYDKALEPQKAYEMLARGMKEGLYTEYKLSSFIRPGHVDYRGARRIVNGTDKAVVIAGFAIAIEKALRTALIVEPSPAQPEEGFVKNSDTPAPETKEDILDSVPNVSGETLKKGSPFIVKAFRSVWTRIAAAMTAGEYLKLSFYIVLAVVAVILIYHYRRNLIEWAKKLKNKVVS